MTILQNVSLLLALSSETRRCYCWTRRRQLLTQTRKRLSKTHLTRHPVDAPLLLLPIDSPLYKMQIACKFLIIISICHRVHRQCNYLVDTSSRKVVSASLARTTSFWIYVATTMNLSSFKLSRRSNGFCHFILRISFLYYIH